MGKKAELEDPVVQKKDDVPRPETKLSMDEHLIRKALEYFAECLHDTTEAVLGHEDPTSEMSDKLRSHLNRMKSLRNALQSE